MLLARPLPSVLTAPFVVVALSFVPGTLVVVALADGELRVGAEHVLYAFGASLLTLMASGALVNVLLPQVGVAKPLMPVPLGAGVTVAVALLAAVAAWRNPTGTVVLDVPPLWSPAPLALLLIPLLAVLGVSLLNATGNNTLLLAALVAVALVPLVAVRSLADRWYPLAVWAVGLALLYHKSLWRYAGFGGRPHGITAWEAGRWSPGVNSIEPYSTELLQNGVLFPLFARLSDLFIITQYEVVNPFLVSFVPVAMYVTFRRYVRPDVALLGASVFAFLHPFYLQYPTAGRAATPVLFLVLFGVTLSNTGLATGRRSALGVAFLAGVVVTHYGTSYYVAAGFAGALVILYALWFVDDAVRPWMGRVGAVPDGGRSTVQRARQSRSFSAATVSFFASTALGWYLYTRQGWKFNLLPKHVYDNLLTLISGPTVEGRTAARVQEVYTAPSIQLSKNLYILLAVLTAVGFAVVYARRVLTQRSSFDDHYLAIATALFGIFGSTLVLSNWGGGRPMMITFSFTTVFAAVGAVWLVNGAGRTVALAVRGLPGLRERGRAAGRLLPEPRSAGVQGFAVLLLVLLVLNTGVGAATVLGGSAPSNVPAQAKLVDSDAPQTQVTVHRETDIATHVWLVQHLDPAHPVHGDTFAARQFDWYRPDVAARTPAIGGGYTSATKPEVFSVPEQAAGRQPGYLLVVGHNLELGAVWPGKFSEPIPLEEIGAERRNRIYTTGESHVYFYAAAEPPASGEDG